MQYDNEKTQIMKDPNNKIYFKSSLANNIFNIIPQRLF